MSTSTKLFLFSLILGASLLAPLQASHFSTAEINYQWIGNEPGQGPNDYRIFVTRLQNMGGVSTGSGDVSICLESLTGSYSQQFNLPLLSPSSPLDPKYTLSASNPVGWIDKGPHPSSNNAWLLEGAPCTNSQIYGEYRYVGTITVPSQAGNLVRLSTTGPCCRDNFDNLAGNPGSQISLALINLRNAMKNNTTPRATLLTKPYYAQRRAQDPPLEIKFNTFQTDADSLKFSLAGIRSGDCNSLSHAVYDTGFSAQSPLSSSTPVSINPRTGTIRSKPNAPGRYLIKIRIEEYKLSNWGGNPTWVRRGFSEKEIPIVITSAYYSPNSQSWTLQADTSMNNASGNPSFSCGDSTILLQAQRVVDPTTLASDASDFLLQGKNQIYPLKKASLLSEDEILVTLRDTIASQDTLMLSLRTGTDSNVIETPCGFPVVRDTFLIRSECQSSGLGLTQHKAPQFELYPNPADEEVKIVQKGEALPLRLLNARGELMREIPIEERPTRLSLRELAPGMYWIFAGAQGQRLIVD